MPKRFLCVTASAAAIALAATACGAPDEEPGEELPDWAADCDTYADYGSFDGETVSISSSIRGDEADEMTAAWSSFAECVGITIQHEGSGTFESDMRVRVDGGNAPDIALFPQPGLMFQFVDNMVPADADTQAAAQEGWTQDWLDYGTVDGQLYAPPHSANAKSFVWYSPSFFEDGGYDIPETWDEMMDLTETIAADGTTPWCVGFESGEASGWPGTDWIEDAVLRESPELYDDWIDHNIPFDDPGIVDAFDRVGEILLNDDYVNGGHGGVNTIATTSFQEAGYPVADGECAMHRQASFYSAMWPDDVEVAEDGDVFIFQLPGDEPGDAPMLFGSEFVASFSDDEAVHAVRQFLASADYHNLRMTTGSWTTAHQGADPENARDDALVRAVEILHDETMTSRFDGSDYMPGEVGAAAFWTGMLDWLGGTSAEDVTSNIENAWPSD
nr:ABC transporter substrate-binding protein [Natronoglycomyces albus]